METNQAINKWICPLADKIQIDPKAEEKAFLYTKWNRPVGIVCHHTVSYDLQNTADWFCLPNGFVGIHFLVGRQGEIWQLSPMNKTATHAGFPWTSKTDGVHYDNVNKSFLGIEAINLGSLIKQSNGTYKDYWNKIYTGPVRERYSSTISEYRFWEPFTDLQEKSYYALLLWLIKRWEIKIDDVVAHYEGSPKRKNDPFGGFRQGPMSEVRKHLSTLLNARP